jgi:DNA repair protein RecO (recombination protein O)
VQPFVPFLVSWTGKTDLVSLGSIEANGSPYFLMGRNLLSGFYLNELLIRLLLRYDPHPELYKTYQLALSRLQREHNPQQALRLFEKQLLDAIGYGLILDKEINGSAIIADVWYFCDPEKGFFRNHSTTMQSHVFQGKTLLALCHNNLKDEVDLQAAKRLMRMLLTPLLGDKPIRSRELFINE